MTRSTLLIIAICLLALRLASAGLGDEGAVSLDGDMPRYLMNGVFLHDLLQDFPLRAPLTYAQHYYARYPALSLGHHPVFPAVAQVPFYFVFGISVLAARLSVLCALVAGIILWFRLVRSLYDAPTAAFASLLLLTTPGFVALFRVVLSEPYTLSLIMVALFAMHRFGATSRPIYAVAFVVSAVLSAYSKHLALVMFPVYAFQFASAFGVRRLVARRTLIVAGVMAACLLPLVPLTLKYSQFNVMLVTRTLASNDGPPPRGLREVLARFVDGPFAVSPALLSLAAVAVATAVFRRDRRVLLGVIWVASAYLGLMVVAVRNERFTCYWLPAFALLGASVFSGWRTSSGRAIAATALAATVVYQWWGMGHADAAARGAVRLSGAGGYEEAAEIVTGARHGHTVLYNAAVDSGYFTFFVRKHDPAHEVIVLRADKLLTTSRMARLAFETRVHSPDEVLPLIERHGVGYVVVEEGRYPDGPLRWLDQVVSTDAFSRVRRIPVQSTDRRLRDKAISVYRYRGIPMIDPDTHLSINVPAMNEQIGMRLMDLVTPAKRPRDDDRDR